MKNTILFFSFCLLMLTIQFTSLAQSVLKGNWTGILYQNPSSGNVWTEYKFSMNLDEKNGIVTGVSTIIAGANYGILDLKGTFKNETFVFEEHLIEKEKLVENFQWCFKSGILILKTTGKKLTLEGNWNGFAMNGTEKSTCSPGKIVISKEIGFISLKGNIVNEKTTKPIPSRTKIVNKTTGKQVALFNSSNGAFDISLPGSSEYEITVESKGYHTRYEHLVLSASKILNIPLTPIEVGQTVPIPFIHFEKSTSLLTKDSYPALDRLFKFMIENPTVKIELQGHTSNEGDPTKNIELSEQRVKTIKDVLIQKGIVSTRINLMAYGAQKPLVPNDTEENRKLNRRVELLVLGK